MLTRLKIDGFKNLRSVDLRFGFFTCIAGQNGVGKSNLFDAIKFLSDLASMPIMNAATSVRGIASKSSSFDGLFGRSSDPHQTQTIEFLVEAVVPASVKDDYGQDVSVGSTCMEYRLGLRLVRGDPRSGIGDRIELTHEDLVPRKLSSVKPTWKFEGLQRVSERVKGQKTNPLIETLEDSGNVKIILRGDRRGEKRTGAPQKVPLSTPRTVLSSVDSDVHASHLAMKREFQSWRLLQLEPSALREPDAFNSESRVSPRGSHLPSALRRINQSGEIAADMSDLIRGVGSVEVLDNEVLQLRTLAVRIKGQLFPASALSDGTLRFLALSILAVDPDSDGLICMEEPENGIHPTKIPEMVALVKRLADDPLGDVDSDDEQYGLRQVIINTHSPMVLPEVSRGDILFASAVHLGGDTFAEYLPLKGTWRSEQDARNVAEGEIKQFVDGGSAANRPKAQRLFAVSLTQDRAPRLPGV